MVKVLAWERALTVEAVWTKLTLATVRLRPAE